MPSPIGQLVLANKEEEKNMGGTIRRKAIVSAVSLFVVFSLVFSTFPAFVAGDSTRQDEEAILRIGSQDEPKTRNILASGDVWTANVLGPVYDSVTQLDPETEELKPYILKGTDTNGNGEFDHEEYADFGPLPGKPLEVVAFYDFNGVLFHDGYQATVEDLLFTYHMEANDPRAISLDVLKDKNNIGGNYTTSKWLWLNKVKGFLPVDHWNAHPEYTDYTDPDYNNSLRAAVHFVQQVPYANFYRYTMGYSVLPRHLWEGTGCLYDKADEEFNCNIHRKPDGTLMDFGVAYDPVIGNGNKGPSPKAFDFGLAESWDLEDEYVIGTGPFKFETWQKAAFASLTRNDEFYEGEPYIHKPIIDGMLFKMYRTTQTAVFALKSGDIDYIAWSIPPDFVPELLNDPNIGISSTAEKGFFYLSYNMRKVPFGYPDGDPENGDEGLNFRRAVAHLIDKKTIVTNLLQNYGIVADGPVSPSLARWYNSSLPTFGYDPNAADGYLDTYDEWEPSDGPCLADNPSGCRNLPGMGTGKIKILTPAADYDPIRAAAGNLIAQAMREQGINAVAEPTAFGRIIQRIDARDFDMFILGWRIGSDPPDYFHAFFYSRNAEQGQNYPGYKDDEFDDLIVRAREELDPAQQEFLIKWAQGVLAEDRPYDVLYFRTNIEAYRSDRFTNWTVGAAGSIYSYWTWLGIHRPPPEPLRITTSIQTAVKTDSTALFTATVRDPQGDVLEGASVTVYVDSSDLNQYRDGNLTYGTTTSNIITGETDVNGQLKITYEPPTLTKTDLKRTAAIFALATHPSYPESRNATIGIVIYPPGEQFLVLKVDLLGGDLVEEERPTLVSVEVQDQDENPMTGVEVTVTSVPPADITPNYGFTDSNGYVQGIKNVEFLAPRVESDDDYRIEIIAGNVTDYEDTNRTFTLVVANVLAPSAPLDLTIVFVVIGVIVALVVVFLLIAALRGGKRTRRRRIKKLKVEKEEVEIVKEE